MPGMVLPPCRVPRPTLVACSIVISGSSGLIGTAWSPTSASEGHDVVRLVRAPAANGEATWDPKAGHLDPIVLDGADAVINLAGAGIGDKRWTDEYKEELVEPAEHDRAAARTIATVDRNAVRVFLSGLGDRLLRRPRDAETLDERSTAGTDFLAELCVRVGGGDRRGRRGRDQGRPPANRHRAGQAGWGAEEAAPVVQARAGRPSSATASSTRAGSRLEDEVRAISFLLDAPVSGAGQPHRPERRSPTAEFTKTLASVLKRPALLPIPSFGPKLLLGGELVEHLLLTGQRVLPTVLQQAGFEFRHPELARRPAIVHPRRMSDAPRPSATSSSSAPASPG